MTEKVLVVNAGSSSIKWALFDTKLNKLADGLAERIKVGGNLKLSNYINNTESEKALELSDHKTAVEAILKFWKENKIIDSLEEIKYIGFRVVHGADFFLKSSKIDQNAIEKIKSCSVYAPLHNPPAVQVMNIFSELLPKANLAANFDTSFHTTIPAINSTYPINKTLSDKYKIKKYGAHGISHRFITQKMAHYLNKEKINIINLHLGNGSSICAIKDSKSFDTTMGLTPLAGVMMGTRSGDIDPSIHNFICKNENISIQEFTDILNNKSGLLGVSQLSSDMRDLVNAAEKGNAQAEFTLELFAQKIADYVASFANKIGTKLDGIIFTAGIGENASATRKRIISKLHFAEIEIDEALNIKKGSEREDVTLISTKNSKTPVYIVKTNEELMIAQDTLELYGK